MGDVPDYLGAYYIRIPVILILRGKYCAVRALLFTKLELKQDGDRTSIQTSVTGETDEVKIHRVKLATTHSNITRQIGVKRSTYKKIATCNILRMSRRQ